MKKYNWLPTECAPVDYPVQIYSGDILYGEQDSIYIPSRSAVNNGWGQLGSTDIAGEANKEVPEEVKIAWHSFVENKNFAGSFKLDVQRIDSLFEKGFQTDGGHSTFNCVKVGMAPGGIVVVWLQGDRYQVEVGRFEAKETGQFDWKKKFTSMTGTFEDYRKAVIAGFPEELRQKIAQKKITYGIWDTWRQRHNWAPVFTVPGVYQTEISYFNQEREDIYPPQLSHVEHRELAVPQKIDILWHDNKNQEMVTTVTFDEEEAFKQFGGIKAGQKGDLKINLDPKASTITIILKTGGTEAPFQKQQLETHLR